MILDDNYIYPEYLKSIILQFPEHPIMLRNSCDRYGFAYLMSKRLLLHRVPRAFSNWLHGWIWWSNPSSRDLMFDPNLARKKHVVACEDQAKSLTEEGFSDVVVGGLPFAYTDESNVLRQRDTLLAMPPHSAEYEKISKPLNVYFDYLESQRKNFQNIVVCLHYIDYSEGMCNQIRRRGLVPFRGARPDVSGSLQRMRALFETFEYVTSNTMGSHIAYALFCGCRVSLSGPMYRYDENDFGGAGGKNRDILERLMFFLSEEYLKSNFGYLLIDDVRLGFLGPSKGHNLIGANNILSDFGISRALGWDIKSQTLGYLNAGLGRFRRLISPR
jgi:hypothetical protein